MNFTLRFVLALLLGYSMISTRAQAQTVITLGSGFSYPAGIAVDASGNVFVANFVNGAVQEILAVNGRIPATNPTITTFILPESEFSNPAGIAIDASGNVFVADAGNNAVKEILADRGSIPLIPDIRTLGSGFSIPTDVAVDAGGDVFVANFGNNTIEEILAVNGSIPAMNPTINTLSGGFSIPGESRSIRMAMSSLLTTATTL